MWKKSDETKPGFDAPPAGETVEAPQVSTPATSSSAGAARPARQPASIGPSITIRGDITGEEDLVVHGRIEGTLNLPKNDITVGADGQVRANLKATRITVEGQVTGDLQGSERVVIKQSGRVEGNITAPRVMLEDGCRFKGAVEMNVDSESKSPNRDARAMPKKTVTDVSSGDKVVHATSGTSS